MLVESEMKDSEIGSSADLSPTILVSTLSLLRASPSPFSTNSTSCRIEAANNRSRSRATIR